MRLHVALLLALEAALALLGNRHFSSYLASRSGTLV